MTNVQIRAEEFKTAIEAIHYVKAAGRGDAILLNGRNLAVEEAEADRIAAAGIAFAYLCDHDGRIVTVPVN